MLLPFLILIFLPEINSRRGGSSRGSSRTSSKTSWGGTSSWGRKPAKTTTYSGPSWNSGSKYRGPTSYASGSSWSKSSPIVSSTKLNSFKNPNYAGLQQAAKKKSMFSKVKTPLMVAGGAYLGYKLGKGIGQLSMLSSPYGMMQPMYGGYGYGPYYNYGGYHHQYHYESPHMYRSYAYNKYPDVKTDSCYECSSIGDSNPICNDMDDKYGASATDVYRQKCPQEGSVCVVTVGRVFPIVSEKMPQIDPNKTDPETLKKWEGKSFTRRACVPPNRQNVCNAYCPTPIEGSDIKYSDECDIYMCNQCDTESCNSWGLLSMPDKRNALTDSQTAFQATIPLLLVLLFAFFN